MKKFQLLVTMIAVLALVGCGDTAKVTGTVKLPDGTTLSDAAIAFENEKMSIFSPLDSNGNFSLFQNKPGDGVPPGTYKGRIEVNLDAMDPGMVSDRDAAIARALPFPQKYMNIETSDLTLTVKPKEAVHLEIVLE